jgi:hypothetical protein
MRTSKTQENAMKYCKEYAYTEFPIDLSIVKQIDRIYSEFLERIDHIHPRNYLQESNYALAVRSYRLLHCAADKLENGYYDVAMTLLRSVYEDLVQMTYFVKDPTAAQKWWLMEKDKKRKQAKMRETVGMTNDIYGLLSNYYSHPMDLKSLIPTILTIGDDGNAKCHPYPYYLHDECRYSFALWIHFANETIKELQNVFKAAQIGDKHWMGKVLDVQEVVRDYAKEIAYDLRKLAKEIEEGEEE